MEMPRLYPMFLDALDARASNEAKETEKVAIASISEVGLQKFYH